MIWVPTQVSENPYIFEGRRIFVLGGLRKKNLAGCKILR